MRKQRRQIRRRLCDGAAQPRDGCAQAGIDYGLEEVVDGAVFERVDRILVVRRHEDDTRFAADQARCLDTVEHGHPDIQKTDVGAKISDRIYCGPAVV